MEAVLLALAAAASAGALWWHQSRPSRVRAALASAFDGDAEVALHVAGHEAQTRGQALASVHMLYGLLQDEAITGAIRAIGKDPEPLEDRVLAALDRLARAEYDHVEHGDEIEYVYGRALHSAYSANRKATCRDLWAYLAGSEAGALIEAGGISHVAILFRLCHGCSEPELDDALTGDVHVVLRNDDYTTRELVCEILQDVFTFTAADAEAKMLQVHTEGRGIVGRFGAAEARTKLGEVRARARSRGYPLWAAIEPI